LTEKHSFIGKAVHLQGLLGLTTQLSEREKEKEKRSNKYADTKLDGLWQLTLWDQKISKLLKESETKFPRPNRKARTKTR